MDASTLAAPIADSARSRAVPALHNGDHLSRDEFHRRYSAAPPGLSAELIEAIVYTPSPLRYRFHAKQNDDLITWMGYYRAKTPGVSSGGNATVKLDLDNEPQPDALLFIPPAVGGQVKIDEDSYIVGAPELVAEVSGSTVSMDLHQKLNAYRRNGVREYVVCRVDDHAIDYFILREGQFVPPTATDGIYKSEVFPGLWLNAPAMLAGDLAAVFAAVDKGIAASDHAAFAKRVRPPTKRPSKPSYTIIIVLPAKPCGG